MVKVGRQAASSTADGAAKRARSTRRRGADTAPAYWAPRLAKIRVARASKGTGWAIGRAGILTARSVVEPLLAPAADAADSPASPARPTARSAEIVIGASPERSFDATIVWESEQAGLAILEISDRNLTTWKTLLRSHPESLLGYLPTGDGAETRTVTVTGLAGRAGGSETSTVAWMLTAPDEIPGELRAGATRTARGEIDVPRKALPRAARRQGLAGGTVRVTDPADIVLGVTTAPPHGRRAPRLQVALLPDPAADPAFAAALTRVGARPVVVTIDGPVLERFLRPDCLDESLRPRMVADVTDPRWYGTKKARTDIAEPADPCFGWVSRPEQHTLSAAIDLALTADGPRLIVLRGPSAAGKSRLAAQVIGAHSRLRDYALVTPAAGASILDLPRRLVPGRSLIFIDNAQDLPATAVTHDGIRRLLEDRPEAVMVVTLLDLPEVGGGTRLVDSGQDRRTDDEPGADFPLAAAGLSGARTAISDDVLTRTIVVGPTPVWARAGGSGNRSDWALARARKQGLGLGEYLAGYHDLVDHYTAAMWPTRALVDLVADWDRSGVGTVLPLATARMLWERLVPTQLPRDELRVWQRLTPIEVEKRWRGALNYACDEILGCAALLTHEGDGLAASEFARVHIDQGAISAQLWEYLIGEHSTTPLQRVDLGLAALASGTPRRALRAFESVLYFRDSDPVDSPRRSLLEVIARRGIALYHARTGRDEQAVMVYTDLVDTFGASDDPDIGEQVAQALLGIGLTFSKLGSHGQAVSAYTELVTRFRDTASPILGEYVAKGLLGQATTLALLGRHDEERAAYADIVARCSDDPGAAVQAIVEIARAALAGP